MSSALTLDDLRSYAVARSLFAPTSLTRAIEALGFVQADPIRSPARAQDLTLRHRVKDYRAGDLERKYPRLPIEEDFFVNYGFLPRGYQVLMHPRTQGARWKVATARHARAILDFVREHGPVHPRQVDEHFGHGTVTNYWGGSSNATTHLLDALHYRGLLRVTRRELGVRIYGAHEHAPAPRDPGELRRRLDALVDVVVAMYSPLPGRRLRPLVSRLRHAAPQWAGQLGDALARAKQRLSHARVDGVEWYWPGSELPASFRDRVADRVRLLAPFDPIAWDRNRFSLLWGWSYRFEAYVPAARRKLGYYSLPLLWRDEVVGWANLSVRTGAVEAEFGYASNEPRSRIFRRELDEELDRMRSFLGL